MIRFASAALAIALAMPASAETVISEASGNWAGPSNQGFYFLARLTEEEDMARLRIWSGLEDGVPSGAGDPDFDNTGIQLAAFASSQTLEIVDGPTGSVLHLVTEFADEYAEGRIALKIQFIDNQYAVVGYDYSELAHADGGDPIPYDCNVDFRGGQMTEDGMEFALQVDDGMTNASNWTHSVIFDRNICSVD